MRPSALIPSELFQLSTSSSALQCFDSREDYVPQGAICDAVFLLCWTTSNALHNMARVIYCLLDGVCISCV